MKQIMKVFVGVLVLASAVLAQAYPACSGSAVGACSSITTQSACIKSYMGGGPTPCVVGQCNESTGYCVQEIENPTGQLNRCVLPGTQCAWQNGTCTDGGAQCQ